MSRRWLLSLLCLSILSLALVQLTRASGEFRVNESNTKVLFEKQPAEVVLAVENATGNALKARVEIELLDANDNSKVKTNQAMSIGNGTQKLSLPLPISFSDLNEYDRHQLLWQRLHYRLSEEGSPAKVLTEGFISLSEITADLFDLRVATTEVLREGNRYHARAQATHPITRRPVANVRVDGELTLQGSNPGDVKLRGSKTTDGKGYAILEFVLPPRFPQFPHTLQPSGGELRVVGRKGAIVSQATGDVLVDQFARILISTDKPLYQPGQQIHMRALLFSPSKRALANQDALFKITDPEDITVFRTVVKSSRFGVANVDWSIPENTRLGNYRIFVGMAGADDSDQTAYDVRISRYDLPNFSVNVETDRKYYLPGQNAEVKVRADYLFGQPVTRGRVRVVQETQREWNYREQKWNIEEGDKYEGETDANGLFVARVNLTDDHEEIEDDYNQFRDITYAAYFTDPTTNRTEQRRFDLRVTRDAIHVYIIESYYTHDKTLPLQVYVSTFYADGSPARCKVNLRITKENADSAELKDSESKPLATLRTNRYGLAKTGNNVRLPREFRDESEVTLLASAVDSNGRKGSETEGIRIEDKGTLRVETEKSIYRDGEPITALISGSIPDQTIVVDLGRDSNIIRSERVKLRDGRASVTFAYRPEFKDRLGIAAYPDFPESRDWIAVHTILYPHDRDLKVNVRPSQASYRPGEDAQVSLSVRGSEGPSAESALGVSVIDKAVEERSRTDQEFGQAASNFNDALDRFLGTDQRYGAITLRDLERLNTSTPIPPELDLIAGLLLRQSTVFYPAFYGGEEYELEQKRVYQDLTKKRLYSLRQVLTSRYARTAEYPRDESSLRRLLLDANIDFNTVRDPWGMTFRPVFSVFQQSDDLKLVSAGADKRFDTDDDFSVDQLGWPYFRQIGEAIDKAVRSYHQRTGGFIRDSDTLRGELSGQSVDLDHTLDRWGKPYRYEFKVKESTYVIHVWSGGPDGEFSRNPLYSDDFVIWTTSIDYFAEARAKIEAVLAQSLKSTKKLPETDQDLRELLRGSPAALESLIDPWGRPYFTVFKIQSQYEDRVRVENRTNVGAITGYRTEVVPVTRMVALITLRSVGPDGQAGTVDDFSVATFRSEISQQARGASEPRIITSGVVLSGTSGAIYGVVTDPQGASIPGTTVKATRSHDQQIYQTTTNEDGKFSFTGLTFGMYEVRFEAPGFKIAIIREVLVRPYNISELDVTLQVGDITETVQITSEGGVALTTSQSAGVVSHSVVALANVVTKSGSQLSTPRLREYFPETLVWQPSIETDKYGRAQINFKLADNITTWKMLVIGSTEDGQIGTTEKEIRAFQPFFVEHDPPRILTEGDEISLPVVVRNYLDRMQKVDLEIKPESWFSLLGPARKQTSVAAGDATRETFDLRATASAKDGKQRITATGSDDSDAIEKPVTVHPDGEEQSVTAGDILDGSAALELNLPENTIPNSRRAEVKIYPNLMAHVMESVEAILQRPYGCGEQTISSTYPSLLLLRHYKKSNAEFPLRARAERYLRDGYSRLLNYRDEDGGFTYWGSGQPDVALTGYALRFLTEASEVIAVDQDVIKRAQEWLVKQQHTDGSWGPRYFDERDGQRPRAVLTAYLARILAMNKRPENAESLKKALNYLGQHGTTIDEPYLLSSYASAAIDAGDLSRAKPVIDKLRELARADGATTYWSLETNTPFYGWGLAGRVESTAIVVQALTRFCNSQPANCEGDTKLINRGLLFLLRQKDRYGVWYSTQATINVLDAMMTLLSTGSTNQTAGTQPTADVLVNGRVAQTIQMPADRLNNPITVDISQFINSDKNKIEIRRSGGLPFASVQAVANYYVPWSASKVDNHSSDLRLRVKFDKTDGKISDEITCNVEAERVGHRGYGMMLAEVGVPPGADVDRASLETAMKGSGWGISQYDVLPDRVVFYLWPQAGGVKFNFKFRPRFGLNAKTAVSVVYDYYNPESRAVVQPVTFRVK